MAILVDKNHFLYCLAKATENQEANEILREEMQDDPSIINSIRKSATDDKLRYIESMYMDMAVFDHQYKDAGLSDKILEKVLGLENAHHLNFFSNPTPNSKHPVDVVISDTEVNIKEEFNLFLNSISPKISEKNKGRLVNEWFKGQCQTVRLKLNVKGMVMKMPKKGKNKGKWGVTITLARHTKDQKKDSFSIDVACEKNNEEFGENGTVSHIVVWCRIKIKGYWRYKVVSFPARAFLCEPDNFKQYGKQKQYKWLGHTPFSDLIINTGASYQLVCRCGDLDSLIKATGGELIYDSITCNS